ncbi:MAG: response regulator [Nitrosomonas sp.]|nr:response regulator [Nitrosomonas sp.]
MTVKPTSYTKQTTLNQRLLRISRLTLGSILTIAAIVLIISSFSLNLFSLVNSNQTKAEAFTENIAASLVFNDANSAQELLDSLASSNDISVAIIFNDKAERFAYYQYQHSVTKELLIPPSKDYTIGLTHIKINQPIYFQQKIHGNFYFAVDLSSLYWQTAWLMIVILVTSLLALLASNLMLQRLNTAVLIPLSKLSQLIQKVSEKNDYTIRAESSHITEIDTLATGFNLMLEQIGERDKNLATQRDQLEIEVAARTTELLAAKDAAEKASHAKSEFLATMSHEIRTPLNGVLGMNELLLNSELNAQQKIWTESVQTSGQHLLSVINDILDFSKIESGHMQLESVDFDLVDLIEDAMAMFAQQAKHKELEMATQFTPPNKPFHLRGDPFRLRQIVINLVSNAIKFTQQGEVIIRTTLQSETDKKANIHLLIEDTGIGIAPEAYKTIFEHFAQADAKTTRKFGGTGLGLTISKHLIELMGGKIRVESTLGKGTKFYIDLQLVKAKRPFVSEPTPDVFDGIRVLVVDDNQTNREIVLHQLENWNMSVFCAPNGEEALYLMNQSVEENKPFQIVILDMHMPGMDGLELARTIQSNPKLTNTRLMMLTSTFVNTEQHIIQESGMIRFVNKPIRQKDLLKVISDLLSISTSSDTPKIKAKITTPKMTGTVLVAEDNIVNQQVARAMLAKLGLQMVLANNGQEAISLVKTNNNFELILMDCQMPIIDGYEATIAIRQLATKQGGKYLPIVALTANAMSDDRQKCLDVGMDDFLSKPFTLAQLEAMLKRWINHPNKNDKNQESQK